MLRSRARLVLMALVALALLAPGAAQARPARCSAKHSRTLLATKDVRIFRVVTREVDQDRVYGCAYRRNRRVRLGYFSGFDTPTALNIDVAGRYVGYSLETANRGSQTAAVAVTNLISRRRVRLVDVPNTGPFQAVTDLEVNRRGSVAWIEYSAGLNASPVTRIAVRKADSGGTSLLQQGLGIVRGSLALSRDGTLFWRNGVFAQSASLQ